MKIGRNEKCPCGSGKKFKKISITWGYKESFSETGHFCDLYSNLSSRSDQSILWFIIYMDKKIPPKNRVTFLEKFAHKKPYVFKLFFEI